jgi:hypothetical protein
MTYLELCKRLVQEAAVSGEGPASTANQIGEMRRMCNWINTAYEDIQNMFDNWRFLTKDFSFALTQNKSTYTPDDAGLTDFAKWYPDTFRVYITDAGIVDEQWLRWMDYERQFRDSRGFKATQTQTGRPIDFSVKPDNSLIFFPIPDRSIYTVRGMYYRAPHKLKLDIDTPLIPERFQMAIVWRALSYYATYESAPEFMMQADKNFASVCGRLQMDQLPKVFIG